MFVMFASIIKKMYEKLMLRLPHMSSKNLWHNRPNKHKRNEKTFKLLKLKLIKNF